MAGGFTLTTQLSISQSEISKIKDTIAKGVGGKGGLNTFTTQIKLSLAASEIAKIDKLLKGSFKVRPVELSFTASRKSRALIAADLGSYTALRPIPVHLTVSSRSFTDIKRKISASFKAGGTSAARIPIAPTASSLTVVRDFFEKGLATRPIKLPVMASGLAAMHRQITSYFASRPVSINVTPSVSPSPTTRSTRRNASNSFQPTNKLEAGGVKIAKAIEHYGAFTTAVGTFVSLFRAMDDAVKEAIKFDREMIRVSQVTGVSTSGLKDLSEEIGRVSKAYGVSSSEILKSTVTLAQAGLSAKDTKIALEAIAKTGVSATFGDINDTTEASIAIFQQFGKNASELESILSSVNKVSGAFAIESDDITVAVRRAGGAFKAAGGNFTEFMALFTSVRQTTRESAETIATGFRTIFARLQRTSTQNFLKTLGIELLDEGQFVGPYKAIMRIADALKEVQTTDPRFAQIVEELGGFRQVEKVIPLLTQTAVSQRALSIAMRGGTSLTEDAVVAQESLEVQLNKLKQTFLDVVRAFSNNYSIKFIIKSMIELTTVTLELVKALSSIAPVLATLGVLSFAKSAGSIRKGFSGYFGFASGGYVPGSGNSDTVPAMLTPGEFVLNKKAVKNIGVNNLNKANVQNFSGGGLVYDNNNIINKIYKIPKERSDSLHASVQNSQASLITEDISKALLNAGLDTARINKHIIGKNGRTSENALEIHPQNKKDARVLREATRNIRLKEDIELYSGLDEISSSIVNELLSGKNNGIGETFSLKRFLSTSTSPNIAKGFARGKSKILLHIKNFSGQGAVARPNSGEKEILLPNNSSFKILKVTDGNSYGYDTSLGKYYPFKDTKIVSVQRFASGGHVGGSGNLDTVPAMLTPGEFVLKKSTVNKIGVDKLNKINNGNVVGYNSGGVVKFASGGSVSASDKLKTFASNPLFIAALASAFSRLSATADEFNDKLVSAISSLASGIAQIGAIKLALDSFKNKFRGANIPFVGSVGFDEDRVRRNHLSAEQFRIRQEERRDHLARIATLRSTGTYSVPAHRISKYTQRENTNRRLTLEAPRNSFAFARADRERYDERRDALMSKVAVASTIGVVVSSILKSIEDNKVNSGNGNAYSGAAASALGGAAVGAYVGSSFGPYGAVAGALIGGAGTFVTTLDDMSNKIKLVGIEKTFSDLDERLKKVISGKLSVESQLSFIPDSILSTSSQIGSLKSIFDGISGTKERDDILARFKNDQSGFEKFFELVARSSSSMDDFNNKTKGTLAVFSSLSGIKFSELDDSVRKIIESNSKLADIEAKRSVIIQSELDTRVRLISLESAINAAFTGANSLDISSGRAKSRLSGQFDYTEKFDIESIIRSVGEGRFSNTGLAGSLIKNVGANLGEGGKSDVNLANNVIGLPKRLPEILNRLYSQDKLGTKDSFIDRFSNEIGDIPLDIKRSMIAALNEVIGEEGKEANLFEKIEEDLDGVVSKLTKSVQPLFKTFSDFASKIQEQERRIVSSLSVYSDIFQELIENNQKLRDSQRDYTDFINSINGRSPSLSDIVSRRGTDLTSNFGSSSAIDLATRKRMIDEEIDSLNKQRDANLGNIEQFQKLSIAINNLENQSLMAAKGLSNIADDSSNYITSLKQLIEKTRQENQIRSDFAKTLGSGSKDERRNLSKDIFNTALAIKGGLNSIPINEQGAVIEFLQKQGNLSVFGGKGGRETANKLLTDSIVQNSGRNISEEQARRFVENKPKSIDDMLKQLDIAYSEQRTALTSIGVNLVTEGDKLRQAIQKSSSEIVTTLIDIQKQNESSKTQSKKNELEKERALLQNKLAATNRVNEITGFGTSISGIDRARSLSTLLSDRLALSERQKTLTSPLSSNIKFSGPMQTIDGAIAVLESEIAKNIEGFSFSDNLKNTARGMRRTEFDAPKNNRYGSDRGLLEKYAMSEIEVARKKAIRQNLDSLELSRDAFKGYGLDTSKIGEIDTLKSLLNQIGDKDIKSAAELQLSIDKLTKAINELDIPGRATGGFIGGVGNRDSVPAMLMPGEYVLRKAAVKKIGVRNLDKMNNGITGYASGGNVVANAARNVKKEIQDRILSGEITKEQAIAFTERANELDRQARKEAAKMKYEEQRTAIRDKNANSIVSAYSKIGTDKDTPYFGKLRDEAKAAGATKTPLAGFKINSNQRDGSIDNHTLNFGEIYNEYYLRDAYDKATESIIDNYHPEVKLPHPKDDYSLDRLEKLYNDATDAGRYAWTPYMPKTSFMNSDTDYSYRIENRKKFITRELFGNGSNNTGSSRLKIGEGLLEQEKLQRDEYRKEYARNVLQPRLEASSGKGTPRVIASQKKQMVQPVAQRISESPEQQRRRVLQQKVNFSNVTGQQIPEQVKNIAGISNFQEFNKNSANLATAMKEFPSELTLNANHKVEVIFNGAEVLKGMMPAMQEIAVNAANNSLRRYAEMHNLPRAMPVGTVNGNKVS